MNKAAVIIGVNNVNGMTPLAAAADGAVKFNAWAISQGYETSLHTDHTNPVTKDVIKHAVTAYVNSYKFDQLIIFFSGHGIWKGVGDEKWLLSNAGTDGDEAINILAAATGAAFSGIKHIVFISDACRTLVTSKVINQVTGGNIFPTNDPCPLPLIDKFFSTNVGDPSFEKKAEEGIEGYGFFTNVILESLHGRVNEVLTYLEVNGQRMCVVEPFSLKKYLETEVSKRLENVSPAYRQIPQASVESRPPAYLSKFDPATIQHEITLPVQELKESPVKHTTTMSFNKADEPLSEDIARFIGRKDYTEFLMLNLLANNEEALFDNEYAQIKLAATFISEIKDRIRLQKGFLIYCDTQYIIEGNIEKYSINNQATVIELPQGYKIPFVLLKMPNGNAIPLSILDGFTGYVWIENNKLININYEPALQNRRYFESQEKALELELRRALIAKSAHSGRLVFNGNETIVKQLAGYLRSEKAFDPTLGLYASYAYAQANAWEDVKSVYDYMSKEPEPVLFDVRMLTALVTAKEKAKGPLRDFSKGWPLLTQGWAYLSTDYSKFPATLKKLAKHLQPGLWTTFTQEGLEIIKRKFKL